MNKIDKRKLFAAILSIALVTCVNAQDINGNGLRIQRPSTVNDAYSGGLQVYRDTSGQFGGIPGHVNTSNYTLTTVGPNVTSFEWGLLSGLNNYSNYGENVAGYFQGNKFGYGPTWGLVSEVADTTGYPGATVGMEIDNWTTGPDNGNRVGLGVYVGDARYIRGLSGMSTSDGTYGIFVGPTQSSPWSRWNYGLVMRGTTQAGIVLQDSAVRGIMFQGSNAVAIDGSTGDSTTFIRLKPGQKVCFDNYDQYCVAQNPATSDLTFTNAGTNIMRLTPGGHLYLHGQVWQNQ